MYEEQLLLWIAWLESSAFWMMLAYQIKLTGVVEVAAVVLAPSLGLGALFEDCRGKVRVEEKFECRGTPPQCLDEWESEIMGSDSVWCSSITHPT